MRQYIATSMMILILLSGAAFAGEKLPKPDRIPANATSQQKALISEGVSLDNVGRYDDAIVKYNQVLEVAPDVIGAIYELGYSYFHKKDYENALELARRGVQYKSEVLPHLYVLLGNTLDEMGKRAEATDVYKDAIKRSPETALLHFNLGLTLMGDGKLPEAKEEMQKSVALAPSHASSHYVLATLYHRLQYRIPALLALTRFLLIEPDSPRAKDVIPVLERLIVGNVTAGKDPNHINITLSMTPDSKKDEGDFDAIELAMSMSIAAGQTKESKEKSSQFRVLASTYGVMGAIMSNMKKKGFAAKYYAPFYAEVDKLEYIEALVNQAFQAAKVDGCAEWRDENSSKIGDFQKWVSGYEWPNTK